MKDESLDQKEKILVLIASARQYSDTKKLTHTVFQEVPHQEINLLDCTISPYRYENDYPPEDDFRKIIGQVLKAKVVVFATPVYWYAMSGLLKNFLDRWTDLVTVQTKLGRHLKGKTMFLVTVGSEDTLPDGFEIPFKLTAKYFDMRYGGCLYASAAELVVGTFHQGDHREFLRDLQESLKEIN